MLLKKIKEGVTSHWGKKDESTVGKLETWLVAKLVECQTCNLGTWVQISPENLPFSREFGSLENPNLGERSLYEQLQCSDELITVQPFLALRP